MKNSNRRKFLRNSLLAGLGAGVAPIALNASDSKQADPDNTDEYAVGGVSGSPDKGVLTLLQTTDVHCQIHPHDELFWENNQAVFRKTAGYAYIASLFRKIRKENPNTYIVDTGDMFQGSELSIKTTGKAMVPILDSLGYDLYTPETGKLSITKTTCKNCWEDCRRPRYVRICTTMPATGRKGSWYSSRIRYGPDWASRSDSWDIPTRWYH